jgi:Zn finger protein HypA/HybF involved in hydrogenase expression
MNNSTIREDFSEFLNECFDFSTEEGWSDLIYNLCKDVKKIIDDNHINHDALKILQIKEKFGGLRFYIEINPEINASWTTEMNEYVTSQIYNLIHRIENESYGICEKCGNKENATTNKDNWIRTLCPQCREKLNLDSEKHEGSVPGGRIFVPQK